MERWEEGGKEGGKGGRERREVKKKEGGDYQVYAHTHMA